jgi:N utilization substance protein B
MAVIDRNVLRLATWEMLHSKDVPPKVAINEAIELGKRFSTQNSGAFINGILDKIKSRHVDAKGAPQE